MVQAHDLPNALFHFLFRNGTQVAISPHVHESSIQFPRLQMETGLPLFNPTCPRRDFQHPSNIKNNRSNGHASLPFRNLIMYLVLRSTSPHISVSDISV